jgi:predicted PurR-regulated permease PerM
MAVNLNGTTPAAPASNTNVQFQQDGSGNISAYVPISAQEFPAVDLITQAANIAATTLLAVPAAGMYRVTAYIVITQVATTSSTLPSIVITWTDKDNNTGQSITLTATSAGNALTTVLQATCTLDAIAASNIQYSTTGYVSTGATPMQYAVHLRIEKL